VQPEKVQVGKARGDSYLHVGKLIEQLSDMGPIDLDQISVEEDVDVEEQLVSLEVIWGSRKRSKRISINDEAQAVARKQAGITGGHELHRDQQSDLLSLITTAGGG
jgi:hypothetical protein